MCFVDYFRPFLSGSGALAWCAVRRYVGSENELRVCSSGILCAVVQWFAYDLLRYSVRGALL